MAPQPFSLTRSANQWDGVRILASLPSVSETSISLRYTDRLFGHTSSVLKSGERANCIRVATNRTASPNERNPYGL
jgi:hypothetical protein